MEKEVKQAELNEEVLGAVNGGVSYDDTVHPEFEKGNPNDFNNNSGEVKLDSITRVNSKY